MDRRIEQSPSDGLGHVEELLRRERPEATPLELDRIKLRAIARVSSNRPARRAFRPINMPARGLVPIAVAVVLMAGGAGVFVGSHSSKGSFDTGSAAGSQYCPPQAAGPSPKPKNGSNKCGQPKP
jgi:hypothetical protein